MCGINGFIDFKKQSSLPILEAMTSTLAHRGPDGFGLEIVENDSAQVGFGHRRLAIIDLSEHGKQPMQFQENWICFNGEVYNFQELKQELTQLGHTFTGGSDTEMILHAYKEWGAKCVEKFIGMFAFALFDADSKEIFMARDRAGVKPFFYYFKDDLFLFASELKAFHKHPRFQKSVNKDAVAAYMQFGNVPTPHCIFEYSFKLKPGHIAHLDLSTKSFKTSCYWNVYDAYNRPKLDISFDEAKQQTEKIIQSACNYRMVADVPVGVFLSGGYDSATVTALLQKEQTEKIKTFTIGVPDIGLNEAPYAKDIAKHLGTDHTEYTCTEKEAFDIIPDLPFHFDEPFADSSAIPTTLVSKIARKDVTVALSADAGDEVFAGYNRYDYLIRYGKKLNAVPCFVRQPVSALMNLIPADKVPIFRNKYNFHNRYEKLKGILKDPSSENIMTNLSQQFTEQKLQKLMKNSFLNLETAYQSTELQKEYFSPLSYMMAIDYQTYLVDDILQKVDRSTMTAGLEGREPLLDHRVIEFAAQLPNDFKYHNGIKKHILREIAHNYIPKKLLDRPKMGFAIPIGKWMQNDLRDLVETYICQEKIEQQGIFEWSEVNALKTTFLNGKTEYELKIWYLLMFEMWWEKWMI